MRADKVGADRVGREEVSLGIERQIGLADTGVFVQGI